MRTYEELHQYLTTYGYDESIVDLLSPVPASESQTKEVK
jgi:hypothetical protein